METPNIKQQNIPNWLYYKDDVTALDEPEGEPGQYGNMGWDIDNMDKLPKGIYSIFLVVYFTDNYRAGDHIKYLNIEHHPLKVNTGPAR